MRTSVRAEFLFEVVNLYKVNKRLTHQLRRLMCCGFDWSRILPAAEHVIISNNHETVTFIKRLTNTFYCRIKQTFKKWYFETHLVYWTRNSLWTQIPLSHIGQISMKFSSAFCAAFNLCWKTKFHSHGRLYKPVLLLNSWIWSLKKNLHSVQLLFKASIGLCNFKKKKKNLPEYRLET